MRVKIGMDDGSRLREDILDRPLIMINRTHTKIEATIKKKRGKQRNE